MSFSSVFLATNVLTVYRHIGYDRHYVMHIIFFSKNTEPLSNPTLLLFSLRDTMNLTGRLSCTDHTIYTQAGSLLFFLIFFATAAVKTHKSDKNTDLADSQFVETSTKKSKPLQSELLLEV